MRAVRTLLELCQAWCRYGFPGKPLPGTDHPLRERIRLEKTYCNCKVDSQIQDDRCYPDLSELLAVPAPGSPTVSGMSDMDYPLQGPGLLSIPNLPEISSVRRVPLPPELVEQFGRILMKKIC
ncbi:hypothetical protein BTVI_114415 [Pitangus sulphuratus]|nr:hypothetical protein BTVI_114415 [Pitangus sulphuratus]